MFNKALSTAAVALAAARLVSAQTFTECNPLEKTCPAASAFGNEKGECDWTKGECDLFEALPGTTVNYESDGAVFTIEKESNAPTMATHKRIFFGRIDIELKAAPGQGIVTSVVLESLDLDEIDWEWVGGDTAQVQSNYFGKGDTTTYDRGAYHDVSDPLNTFHTYSIEWTSAAVNWIIDGETVRTLKYADAQGGSRFPQTPMEVKIGTWVAGGKNSPKGTVEWAGGYTDFSQAPFNAYYKSISIVDYAGGDSPAKDSIKEYVYGDKTGSWESIKVVKGDGSSDDDDDDEETSSSAAPSKTKTAEPSKTKTAEPTKTKSSDETKTTDATTFTSVTSAGPSTTGGSDSPSTTEGGSGSGSEESGSAATSAPAQVTDPSAANGIFASFGKVAVAGVAAVLASQLF